MSFLCYDVATSLKFDSNYFTSLVLWCQDDQVYHLVGRRRYPLWPLGKLKVSVNSLLILSFVIQPSEHLSFAGRRVAIFSILKPFVFCF